MRPGTTAEAQPMRPARQRKHSRRARAGRPPDARSSVVSALARARRPIAAAATGRLRLLLLGLRPRCGRRRGLRRGNAVTAAHRSHAGIAARLIAGFVARLIARLWARCGVLRGLISRNAHAAIVARRNSRRRHGHRRNHRHRRTRLGTRLACTRRPIAVAIGHGPKTTAVVHDRARRRVTRTASITHVATLTRVATIAHVTPITRVAP